MVCETDVLPREELDAGRYLSLLLPSLEHCLLARATSVAAIRRVFMRPSTRRIYSCDGKRGKTKKSEDDRSTVERKIKTLNTINLRTLEQKKGMVCVGSCVGSCLDREVSFPLTIFSVPSSCHPLQEELPASLSQRVLQAGQLVRVEGAKIDQLLAVDGVGFLLRPRSCVSVTKEYRRG